MTQKGDTDLADFQKDKFAVIFIHLLKTCKMSLGARERLPNLILEMTIKSYFDRVNHRGLNPLASRTMGVEPTPENSKISVLPHYTIFYSKVS